MPEDAAEILGESHRWPRRAKRLATGVVEELVDRVVSGELPVGAALPSEPALVDYFGVSRTVVREAVRTLETMKLIEVRQGAGTTVRPDHHWDLLDPAVLTSAVAHDEASPILDDIVNVRAALEGQMAAEAAAGLTNVDRVALSDLQQQLHQAVSTPSRFRAVDTAFHDAVMQASGNRLGAAIVHTLHGEAFLNARYMGDPTSQDCIASNVGHDEVCERILAGDADRARAAMTEHIVSAWKRRESARKRAAKR